MGSQSAPQPIRLAILEADTPVLGANAKYGGYRGVFRHLFERACAALDPPAPLESQLELTGWDVVNDFEHYPDPDAVDAVLISGSKHNSFEDHEWILRLVDYTRRLLEGGRVRVIGVCFGHQIIGRALGSDVGRSDSGWEVSVTEVSLTTEGKRIFGKDTLKIQQMHRDIVRSHPPGTLALGETPLCDVQGMYIPKKMIAVQGHPEFTAEIMTEIVEMRHNVKLFDDDLYKSALERADKDHDGVLIAQAFLRFLRE